MVQEHQVLNCFSCETFQSHIVKKSNKWECKVCGVKQSIKKVYGRGSGKDCRVHTQKLNSLKGLKTELQCPNEPAGGREKSEPTVGSLKNDNFLTKSHEDNPNKTSKWAKFVDDNKANDDHGEESDPTSVAGWDWDSNGLEMSRASSSEVQKRKVDKFDFTELLVEYPDDSKSIEPNSSTFSRTFTSGWRKKRKFNERIMTLNNSHNSYTSSRDDQSSNYNNQEVCREPRNEACYKSGWKSFSQRKSIGKWVENPIEDSETISSKIPSQNTSFLQDKGVKGCNKWDKYLENEEDVVAEPSNHQSESEIGSENLEYWHLEGALQEEESRGTLDQCGYMFSKDYKSDHSSVERVSSDSSDDSSILLRDLTSNHLRKVSSTKLVSSRDSLKKSTPNCDQNNDSVKLPVNTENYFSCKSVNSSSLKRYEEQNSLNDKKFKYNVGKEDCNVNAKVEMRRQEANIHCEAVPPLPVFEQNIELCDSDFQLSF